MGSYAMTMDDNLLVRRGGHLLASVVEVETKKETANWIYSHFEAASKSEPRPLGDTVTS